MPIKTTTKTCFWPWDHQWSKWQVYDQPFVYDKQQYMRKKQKRICEKCGLEQRREL